MRPRRKPEGVVREIRNPEPGTRNPGFTLVEMLVVIAIIGILATLTVSAAFQVRRTMKVRTARACAQRMAQAIEAYQALKNVLPLHPSVLITYASEVDAETALDMDYQNARIVAALNGVMERDPLLKLETREINEYGSFKDPWGRPLRVVMWKEDPEHNYFKYFEVYSCGPNGKWQMGWGDYSPDADGDARDDLVPRL